MRTKLLPLIILLTLVLASCAPAATPAPVAEAPAAEAPAAQPPAAEAPTAVPAAPEAVAKPVAMDFVVWSYGIETINDNIKKFQELNPDITINLKDYSWLDYHDTMVGRLRSAKCSLPALWIRSLAK